MLGELTSCRGTVQSAWLGTSSETQETELRSGCLETGNWSLRGMGTTVLTCSCPEQLQFLQRPLGVRQGNRQGWWKRSKFRRRSCRAHPRQDRRLQGVVTYPRPQRVGWWHHWVLGGDQGNLNPGSISTESPAGRTLSLQRGRNERRLNVYVRALTGYPRCLVRPWPPVIVGAEKVLSGSGWVRLAGWSCDPYADGNVFLGALGCIPDRRWEKIWT